MSKPCLNLVLLAAAVALPGCQNRTPDTDALDKEIANGVTRERASAGTLGDQIVVDPARAGRQAAGNAIVPASAKCRFADDLAWARRLPAELPLYPGAHVTEAAGSDAAGCRRRIVSFGAPASPERLIAFYRAKVAAAGYSAEHLVEQGSHVLGGTRGDDAYYLTVTSAKGGSTVDLVANSG